MNLFSACSVHCSIQNGKREVSSSTLIKQGLRSNISANISKCTEHKIMDESKKSWSQSACATAKKIPEILTEIYFLSYEDWRSKIMVPA